MNAFANAILGFIIGWSVRMIEEFLTATAWGGPLTILLDWAAICFLSILYVLAAGLLGLLLRVPVLRDAWSRAGYWVLLLALPALLIVVFSSRLGLRTVDPVSNYSMMSLWLSSVCYVVLVFPFVNLPSRLRLAQQLVAFWNGF